MRHFIATLLVLALTGCGGSKPVPNVAASSGRGSSNSTDAAFLANDPAAGGAASSEQEVDFEDVDFDGFIDKLKSNLPEAEFQQPPAGPFDPPLSAADVNDVLQQCVRHVLTDPDLKSTRDFYGTPGSSEVVLVSEGNVDWPADFRPEVDGYAFGFGKATANPAGGKHILGIRLDRLDVRAPSAGFFDGNITITLSNVGGDSNGTVIGGCLCYFVVRREGDKYVAVCSGSLDP